MSTMKPRIGRHRSLPIALPARTACGLLVALLCLCATGPAAAARKYRADLFRSEVRLQADGSLRVHETIRMRFDGGPFTFFHRGVPLGRTEGVDLLLASDSTQVRRRHDELDVTWRFGPVRDTTMAFDLTYLVHGAIAVREDRLEFRWVPFPQDRPYAIDSAQATFILPPGALAPIEVRTRPSGLGLRAAKEQGEAPVPASAALTLAPRRLAPGHTVFITLDLSPATAAVTMPAWQEQEILWKRRTPWMLGLAALILVAGLAAVISQRERIRSGLPYGGGAGPISVVPDPPERISPALAGALAQGSVTLPQAVATMFDLAARGHLRLEEAPRRRFWPAGPPRLLHLEQPGPPEPWERVLLEGAFRKADASGSVDWSKAQSGINRNLRDFCTAVLKALEQRGDRDPAVDAGIRQLRRGSYAAILLGLIGFVPAIFLFGDFGPAVLAPSVAILLLAAAARLAGASLPQWTARGTEKARAWKGFSKYLQEAGRSGRIDPGRFQEYLPYAVALGRGQVWIKAGRRCGAPSPAWYQPLPDSSGNLAGLLAVIAATSSSSAGGSGAAGGSSSAG